jgi:hypothetical protein
MASKIGNCITISGSINENKRQKLLKFTSVIGEVQCMPHSPLCTRNSSSCCTQWQHLDFRPNIIQFFTLNGLYNRFPHLTPPILHSSITESPAEQNLKMIVAIHCPSNLHRLSLLKEAGIHQVQITSLSLICGKIWHSNVPIDCSRSLKIFFQEANWKRF